MPALTNGKWEAFCLGIIAGKSQQDAYKDAGFAPHAARFNAARLITRDNIRSRVAELRAEITEAAMQRAQVKKADVLNGLMGIAEDAEVQPSARVAAYRGVWDIIKEADEVAEAGPQDADLEAADRRLRIVRPG